MRILEGEPHSRGAAKTSQQGSGAGHHRVGANVPSPHDFLVRPAPRREQSSSSRSSESLELCSRMLASRPCHGAAPGTKASRRLPVRHGSGRQDGGPAARILSGCRPCRRRRCSHCRRWCCGACDPRRCVQICWRRRCFRSRTTDADGGCHRLARRSCRRLQVCRRRSLCRRRRRIRRCRCRPARRSCLRSRCLCRGGGGDPRLRRRACRNVRPGSHRDRDRVRPERRVVAVARRRVAQAGPRHLPRRVAASWGSDPQRPSRTAGKGWRGEDMRQQMRTYEVGGPGGGPKGLGICGCLTPGEAIGHGTTADGPRYWTQKSGLAAARAGRGGSTLKMVRGGARTP